MKPLYSLRVLPSPAMSFLCLIRKHITSLFCFLFIINITATISVHGEGTKEVMPNATNGTGLIVNTNGGFPLGNVGSYVGVGDSTPTGNRIRFRIKDYTKETLYYGFNWETLTGGSGPIVTLTNVYMRVYDPNGNLVTTILMPSSAGAGFISSYGTAVGGPQTSPGVPFNGYVPKTFVPAMNGDYYVSFYQSNSNGAVHDVAESMLSKFFDMTVITALAPGVFVRNTGRVHCTEWAFSVYNPNGTPKDVQDPLTPAQGNFFSYTNDSVVTRLSLPSAGGFEPLSFIIAVNSFGVQNTGNWQVDRQSIDLQHLVAPYLHGGFEVFLNAPDSTIWPACVLPSPPLLLNPVISGCPPGPYNVRFQAPQAGDYYLLFDLDGVPGYQANGKDRFVELINRSPGVITYAWDGKDGQGNPVAANSTFPIRFSFRKGRINLPLYDVELNVNGFTVDGIAPVGAVHRNATLYWDDRFVGTSLSPVCQAGGAYNNNNSTGFGYADTAMGKVSPAHAWSGDGNQFFAVPAPSVGGNNLDNIQCNDFGNARLINTWAWGIDTTIVQNLTLTCTSVQGTVWDDADNSANGSFTNAIQTNAEKGVNAGNTLYASLIDPISGAVQSTVPVGTDGTYTLPNVPVNATNMSVVISTTSGIVGNQAPASLIPSTWINTSPLIRSFNSASGIVTGIDFGIEQLPNSVDQSYTIATPILNSLLPLNGFSTISSPGPLAGSDPEDGVLGSNKTVIITSVPSNEELYYNNVLVTNNTTILNYDPSKLKVKFISISITQLSFKYAYVDAAGKPDPTPATYTINTSTTLATTLASLTGRAADQGNVLNWTCYNETNGVYFVIERSADGRIFEPVGQVDGGTNGATGNHTFTDSHPIPDVPNYYRVVLMDLTGGGSFSNILSITPVPASFISDVSPNPFRDAVTARLSLVQSEKISLLLLDGKGMFLRRVEYAGVKGANSVSLSGLSSLPVSVYFLQIVLPDQVIVRKIFNQR